MRKGWKGALESEDGEIKKEGIFGLDLSICVLFRESYLCFEALHPKYRDLAWLSR